MPSGGVIAGQAALIHLDGWTTEDMAIRPSVAMRIDFPTTRSGSSRYSSMGRTPYAEQKRRYEQQLRELDEFFELSRRYQQAKAARVADFKSDPKFEAMLPLLEGKMPALMRADREKDIRQAIKFAGKQKLRMILQSGRQAWKLAAELIGKLPESTHVVYLEAAVEAADVLECEGVRYEALSCEDEGGQGHHWRVVVRRV
jgi:hypothetical protein